jgi:hypothetical protein
MTHVTPEGERLHPGVWPPVPDPPRPEPLTAPVDPRAELARLRATHRQWAIMYDPFKDCWIALCGKATTGRTLIAHTLPELAKQLAS